MEKCEEREADMNMAEGQRFENKRKQEEVIGKSGPGKEKRVAVRGKGRMVQEKIGRASCRERVSVPV